MRIDTIGISTMEELEAAWLLVAKSKATLACGCDLTKDERDCAQDLAIICKEYIKAYDQRFI